MATLELEPSWLDPYIAFLSDGSLSNDTKEDGRLYQHSFGGPYLLCLHPRKNTKLLAELQEGVYGGHLRGRSLAH